MPTTTAVVRTVGLKEVQLKLMAAQPRILAHNTALVTSMLEMVKSVEVADTPFGPAHFGYHGRDTVHLNVRTANDRTVIGKLMAGVQLYWREYGTLGQSRRFTAKGHHLHGQWISGHVTSLTHMEAQMRSAHTGGGEKAYMVANKALNATRAMIRFYYGGMATWWKSG